MKDMKYQSQHFNQYPDAADGDGAPAMSRRAFLVGAAGIMTSALGAIGLVGCSSGGETTQEEMEESAGEDEGTEV